jgi:hypothetical protein
MSVDHLIQDLLASRESTMAEAYGLALDTLGIESHPILGHKASRSRYLYLCEMERWVPSA